MSDNDIKNMERLQLAKRLLESVERGIKAAMEPVVDDKPVLSKEQGKQIYEAMVVASLQEQYDNGEIAEA